VLLPDQTEKAAQKGRRNALGSGEFGGIKGWGAHAGPIWFLSGDEVDPVARVHKTEAH